MAGWEQTTRQVTFEDLQPEFVEAIGTHIEKYRLGSVVADAVMCVQTESVKAKGLFSRAEVMHQGVLLTPTYIVVAVTGTRTNGQTAVLSAKLQRVEASEPATTRFGRTAPGTGVQLTGRFTNVSKDGFAFISLDDGPAGVAFREALIGALEGARK